MKPTDAGSSNRERLANLLQQELSEADARPSIHRWSRRRDQRVIPIELAAVGGNAHVEENAGDATENSVAAENSPPRRKDRRPSLAPTTSKWW